MRLKSIPLKYISLLLFALLYAQINAQTKFKCNDMQLTSSSKVYYVNPKLKTKDKAFTFRTVNDALSVANGKSGVTIYIEPSVYWIDNPNDPQVRKPLPGENEPFGMKLKFDDVNLVGLSSNPKDVVLACNRGQTQGAVGNFTMFHITGDNIHAENITFGNYCNVDLDYKLNPSLNRKRRADAIVQAQLVICRGKNYTVKNCEFISRLNLCPFVGADDVHFENCYFECTDDALCGTGIYDKCSFTFYSSKPFYCTSKQGAVFRDCDIYTKVQGTQYLTKVSDKMTMLNCRWTSDDPNLQIQWTKKPNPKDVCLCEGCTLNGKPLILPPTPDVPMPVGFPYTVIKNQPELRSGKWTLDAYKPLDTKEFDWDVSIEASAWAIGEGMDGAEGCRGYIENVKGSRMMYTGIDGEKYDGQQLTIDLNPCKSKGQGFGSATGQYLDVCIKFDTRTLTGYGIRFIRTTKYDNAIDIYLVKYESGVVTPISEPTKCELYKRGCHLMLKYEKDALVANVSNGEQKQSITASNIVNNNFGGIHIQHTGSTGASATVISSIDCIYL